MRNFKQNHEEMNWPWVESPFFNELLKHQELTDEQKELAIKLNKDGYVILDLGLTDEQIDAFKIEIDTLNDRETVVTQADGYHYSKGKRIFEGWKDSEMLQSLSLNPVVIDTLMML